jgi:hypothetical protein
LLQGSSPAVVRPRASPEPGGQHAHQPPDQWRPAWGQGPSPSAPSQPLPPYRPGSGGYGSRVPPAAGPDALPTPLGRSAHRRSAPAHEGPRRRRYQARQRRLRHPHSVRASDDRGALRWRAGSGRAGRSRHAVAAEQDPELRVALVGRFDDHHAVMSRMHLERVRDLEDGIASLDRFRFQHGAEELPAALGRPVDHEVLAERGLPGTR